MKKSQDGFSTPLILVSVLVIAIIIGVGYYILKNEQTAKNKQYTARYHFEAENDIKKIASGLEDFYLINKYYPSDIEATTLSDLRIQVSQDAATEPANTKFVYTPFPEGCVSKVKDCSSFTLSAVDISDNTNILTVRAQQKQ